MTLKDLRYAANTLKEAVKIGEWKHDRTMEYRAHEQRLRDYEEELDLNRKRLVEWEAELRE